jgi:hypothetical protein
VLQLPLQLRKLDIDLASSVQEQQAIAVIGRMRYLTELMLRSWSAELDFSLLAGASKLEVLQLESSFFQQKLTATQSQQLRQLHGLRSLQCSSVSLSTLLVLPHQLQLSELSCSIDSEADAAALAYLPSLTKLTLSMAVNAPLDLLAHLPLLTSFSLFFRSIVDNAAGATVFAALQTCSRLTELALHGCNSFTSQQLAGCLHHMPELQSLTLELCTALTSLDFLSTGTLRNTLTKLKIGDCAKRIPLLQLCKVHELHNLRNLHLRQSTFDKPLDELTCQLHKPPSRLLPHLQHFIYIPF